MSSSRLCIAVLLSLLATATSLQTTLQAQEEIREWTDKSGKFKVKAKFDSVEEQTVVLNKADGTQIRVPISRLSQSDQDYLTERSSNPSSNSQADKQASKVPVTELLKSPATFTITNHPLAQCVKQISEELSINVILSTRNARAEGPTGSDAQINYRPSNQSVADALDSILSPLGLSWTDQDGVLVISSVDTSPLIYRVYRAKAPAINSSFMLEIMNTVEPSTWGQNGGAGVMQLLPPNRIVAYNRSSVLRELEKSYAGKLVTAGSASTKKKTTASSTGLDRPISVDFQQTPLRNCITQISERTQLKLSINERAMSESGISPDSPITLKLENVRAETVLKLMLRPLALGMVTDKENVSITSRQDANQTFVSAEHNIGGILGSNLSPIIQLITTVIAPDSWEQNGGNASISVKPPSSISVRQTTDNQSAIKKLLTELREASR